ncbi:MAG: hypothetical protein J6I40_00890 [Mailhella sp.]|nr:hypothetical protein [Mailhella sp.]
MSNYPYPQQAVPVLPVIPVAPVCITPPVQQAPACQPQHEASNPLGPTLLEIGCRLLIALAKTRLQ